LGGLEEFGRKTWEQPGGWKPNQRLVVLLPIEIMRSEWFASSLFALSFGVRDYRCSEGIFPGDVVYCFICFVGEGFSGKDKPRFLALILVTI
jgi:hypothetical protein